MQQFTTNSNSNPHSNSTLNSNSDIHLNEISTDAPQNMLNLDRQALLHQTEHMCSVAAETAETAAYVSILNISTYQFVELSSEQLNFFKKSIFVQCQALDLKGTTILAHEGINMFLAGRADNIRAFFSWINQIDVFSTLCPKESFSNNVPFRRLIVKIKPEIITFREQSIKPQQQRASAVSPKTLKQWLDQGVDDEGRPVVMLDTRNQFEVKTGSFDNALDFGIHKFTEFVPAIQAHQAQLMDKTVVSFCTGGIRCEKAAILMKDIGLSHVYQLDGGILKYFEEVGAAHYHGECFVFDYRTALKPDLTQSTQLQCYSCRSVLTEEDQRHPLYQPPHQCSHCAQHRNEMIAKKAQRIAQKTAEKIARRKAHCAAQKAKHTLTI